MPSKSTRIILIWSILILLTAFDQSVCSQDQPEETDPVLTYYWDKATAKAPVVDPATDAIRFSCTVMARRYRINSNGRLGRGDSALINMFFTGNTLDSQQVIKGNIDKIGEIKLNHADPFAYDYRLNFFPNDTGGAGLAIGLVSDSALAESQPDGLMVIDRKEHYLRSLYYYYPEKSGYKRFTRMYVFQMVEGLLFPREIVEIATQLGVFMTSTYRLELEISGVKLLD